MESKGYGWGYAVSVAGLSYAVALLSSAQPLVFFTSTGPIAKLLKEKYATSYPGSTVMGGLRYDPLPHFPASDYLIYNFIISATATFSTSYYLFVIFLRHLNIILTTTKNNES